MLGKKCNEYSDDSYEYNYSFVAGDTEEIAIIVEDSEGTVVSIQSGKVQLRTDSTSETVVLEKTGTFDSESGVFTVPFTSEETQQIIGESQSFVVYKYDLELILQNGDTYTPIFGCVKIKQSITR